MLEFRRERSDQCIVPDFLDFLENECEYERFAGNAHIADDEDEEEKSDRVQATSPSLLGPSLDLPASIDWLLCPDVR